MSTHVDTLDRPLNRRERRAQQRADAVRASIRHAQHVAFPGAMGHLPSGCTARLTRLLPDGEAYMSRGRRILWIGTRPMTEVEHAAAMGRWIARRGLADVLEYTHEGGPGDPPAPSGRGRALYLRLARL